MLGFGLTETYTGQENGWRSLNEHFWEKPQAIKISVSPFLRYNFKINSFLTVVPESKRAKGQARRKCSSKEEVPRGKEESFKQVVGITGTWTEAQEYFGWVCLLAENKLFRYSLSSNPINYSDTLACNKLCNHSQSPKLTFCHIYGHKYFLLPIYCSIKNIFDHSL